MQRLVRTIAIVAASSLAAIAGAAGAQVVDPALAGFWTGRSAGEQVLVELFQDGSFRGTIAAARAAGPNDCAFRGQVGAREVSVSTAEHFIANGTASTSCRGRRGPDTPVSFDARPRSMTFKIREFTGQLVRGLQLGAADNAIDSPDIPGHWEGTSGGVHASVDLKADGNFSGTVSGPGLEGCTFTGSIPPAEAFDNDAESFTGFGEGAMSGCADATLNRNDLYLAILGATPERMSVAFLRIDNRRTVFEVEGMTRTSPALGGTAAADARAAKAGMWNSPLASGWGMSLIAGKTTARTPFVVLYVYGSDKTPTWYVMSSGTWTDDNNFTGDLYATTGTDWRAPSFNSGSVTVNKVGTLSMTFTSNTAGTLTYRINDGNSTVVRSSPMAKQGF